MELFSDICPTSLFEATFPAPQYSPLLHLISTKHFLLLDPMEYTYWFTACLYKGENKLKKVNFLWCKKRRDPLPS